MRSVKQKQILPCQFSSKIGTKPRKPQNKIEIYLFFILL